MNTDNSETKKYEPRPSKIISKGQTVLESSLDELDSIRMEDEVQNVLVTIINLMISSGKAKLMVRHLWKAVELHE
jgi:hypothetical protein